MAELSGFWTTSGAGSGDQQASYSQADFSDAYRILSACAGFEGVAPGFLNELACTDGGSETVAVNTGGAMVDGKWFLNDASQNVTVAAAVGAGNTRIDRIVLRASWAGFNVSVHRIAGTDAATPTAPAITQTSETTYDIMLCQALVDTSGNITVTDERTWAAVNANGIKADAVTTAKILDGNVTLSKMAANSVDSDQYVDGSIDTAHIGDDQVTPAKTSFFTDPGANGAVYIGKVNSDGTAGRLPSGWSSAKSSTATYTVTHNLNGNNVAVATPATTSVRFITLVDGVATLSIKIYDNDGNLADSPFRFLITRYSI